MTKMTLAEWIHDAIVRYNGNHADRRALLEVIRSAIVSYELKQLGKPKLTRHKDIFVGHIWKCSGAGTFALGPNPKMAYSHWVNRIAFRCR